MDDGRAHEEQSEQGYLAGRHAAAALGHLPTARMEVDEPVLPGLCGHPVRGVRGGRLCFAHPSPDFRRLPGLPRWGRGDGHHDRCSALARGVRAARRAVLALPARHPGGGSPSARAGLRSPGHRVAVCLAGGAGKLLLPWPGSAEVLCAFPSGHADAAALGRFPAWCALCPGADQRRCVAAGCPDRCRGQAG